MRTWRKVALAALVSSVCWGPLAALAETVTYTYDARGRLKTATYSTGAVITYSYDDAGNRTQLVITGGTNTAPVANTDSQTTAQSTATATFDPRVNDTDANGDTLTITAKTNGANGVATIMGGGTGLTFAPTTGFSGSTSFTYTISDGIATAVGTVNVTVTAANQAPTAVDDSDTWTEYRNTYYGDPFPFPTSRTVYALANDTDPESQTLSITSVSTPTNSAVATIYTNAPGPRILVTNIGASGTTFTYTISDGNGGTDTGSVVLTVYYEVCEFELC